MLDFLRKLFRATPAPVALPRRMKIYAADSGYVYHYYFLGRQDSRYRFEVSSDRRTWAICTVVLEDAALRTWETANVRALTLNERYGLAKLALFAAFDERDSPNDMATPILASTAQIAGYARRLGL